MIVQEILHRVSKATCLQLARRVPNGQKKERYKGVGKRQNRLICPLGQPRARFYVSGLGDRETAAIGGLPEAEANFRDLHHRLMAIF